MSIKHFMSRTLLLTMIGLPFIAGCSLMKPVKSAPVVTYTLDQFSTMRMASRPSSKTILIAATRAAPGYESTQMLYTTQPYRVAAYANHAWLAPPAKLITPLLAESIRRAHYFHSIAMVPFTGSSDFRLDTRLLELQQGFEHGKSEVRLSMRVQLINNHTQRFVGSQSFTVKVPAMTNNPYGGVQASNKAVRIMLSKIARFTVRNAKRSSVRLESPQINPLPKPPKLIRSS